MKIFLLHGDDPDKSNQRLMQFIDSAKKRNWEIIYLDESPLSVKENIASVSLFANIRFFVHRDIKKLTKEDIAFLSKNIDNYDGNLILFSGTLLTQSTIKNLSTSPRIPLVPNSDF